MSSGWRRIGRDLKNRRYVDSYSVAFVTFVLAVLSLALMIHASGWLAGDRG
jgi:hypothetical protein